MPASNDSSSNDTRNTDDPQVEARPELKVVEPDADAEPGTRTDTDTDTEPDAAPDAATDAGSDAAQATAAAPLAASQAGPPDRSTPAAADPPAAPRASRLPWLLGVALVFAVIFALWQGQRADRFATEVERLTGELEVVGAELSAHQSHLSRVRVGIDDLASRTLVLSDLAHAEPGAAAEPGPDSETQASGAAAGEGADANAEPRPQPAAEVPRITDF